MATSGSINFTLTRDEIIQEALELLGVIGVGETPSAENITTCARSLNMMVKSWEQKGIHLWTKTTQTVTLVESQASYTLSPRPLMIKQAFLRNTDDIDRPVRIESISDYNLIANKTETGKISRISYDTRLSTGVLNVWPTPDDDTDVLHLVYLRSIEDFDSSTDNPDLPQECLEAICQNLAVRIAPKYGRTLSVTDPDLLSLAANSMAEMYLWDVENAKIKLVPGADFGN